MNKGFFDSPMYIVLFTLIPDKTTRPTISPNIKDVFVISLMLSGSTQETGIMERSTSVFFGFSERAVRIRNIAIRQIKNTHIRSL